MPKNNKKPNKCQKHNKKLIDEEIGCTLCIEEMEDNINFLKEEMNELDSLYLENDFS